jgi:hypothetical protein
MPTPRLCRAALGAFSFFVLITPVAPAAPPANGTAEPTVTTQTPLDSPSVPVDAQSCRYKPLPGSHIKVQVCTTRERALYRMDRRARTIAVDSSGGFFGAAVPAPLPQVQ